MAFREDRRINHVDVAPLLAAESFPAATEKLLAPLASLNQGHADDARAIAAWEQALPAQIDPYFPPSCDHRIVVDATEVLIRMKTASNLRWYVLLTCEPRDSADSISSKYGPPEH